MKWNVYVLKCRDGSLYTGIAKDVEKRLAQHNAGRGARYTRGRGPVKLLYREARRTVGSALRREAEIKSWDRAGKLAFLRRKAGR